MDTDSPTLAVLFHRLGPYHFARLRAIGQRMPITAIESSREDNTYDWEEVRGEDGFKRITLFEKGDSNSHPRREVVRRVQSALNQCQPSVVAVPGWSGTEAFAAIEWCGAHRVPVISMSESTAWDEERGILKEHIKSRIVRLAAVGLVGGTPHADYIAKLGIPRDRVFFGYNVVDNGYFRENTEKLKSETLKSNIRTKYGLPEKYFLASARFVEKKNLTRLIEAYARYRELAQKSEVRSQKSEMPEAEMEALISDLRSPISVPWLLVLLGDGPLKPDLCRLIADLGLQHSVRLPGFKQYDELPAYYGCASAFIHASTTEQWGLVVNEAMAAGLPVLISNRCGCAQDLVQEGVNGFTFDPYNIEEMANAMLKISLARGGEATPPGSFSSFQDVSLSAFGDASRKLISNWDPERFAKGMSQAVEMALSVPPRKAGIWDRLLLKLLLLK